MSPTSGGVHSAVWLKEFPGSASKNLYHVPMSEAKRLTIVLLNMAILLLKEPKASIITLEDLKEVYLRLILDFASVVLPSIVVRLQLEQMYMTWTDKHQTVDRIVFMLKGVQRSMDQTQFRRIVLTEESAKIWRDQTRNLLRRELDPPVLCKPEERSNMSASIQISNRIEIGSDLRSRLQLRESRSR